MSRAEDAARKAYPILPGDTPIGKNVSRAFGKIYQNGYEQAEKDIISLIESRIGFKPASGTLIIGYHEYPHRITSIEQLFSIIDNQ